MNKQIRFFLCCVCTLALLVNTGYAAERQTDSSWDIPFLGRMTDTEGFQAIDMENWMKTFEGLIKKETKDNPKTKKYDADEKPLEMPPGIKIYQLQVNDGKAYHIAAAIAVKDEKGDVPGVSVFFSEKLEPEQAKQLADWNERIRQGIKMAQEQLSATNFANFRVLDLKLLERMKGTNEVVYSIGGRVLLDMNGAVFPVYTKAYFLEREGKAVVIALMTSDADGKFWEKTTDRLLRTLK